MTDRIAILGAGPVGLGAAYRLSELGYRDWILLEKADRVGGHSRSWQDERGFWWDEGGHVIFSHYPYFNDLLEKLLGGQYTTLQRSAWIRMRDRWVPYPLQFNLRHLPRDVMWDCIKGVLEVAGPNAPQPGPARNFLELLETRMGHGITDHFMGPYNRKVWAHPLDSMSVDWIAERVPLIDVVKTLENVIQEKDDVNWGPNALFRFPLRGGTGAIYEALIPHVKHGLRLSHEVVNINTHAHELMLGTGETVGYDHLISSMPLDRFVRASDLADSIKRRVDALKYSKGIVIGLGIRGAAPDDLKSKTWIYFPEPDVPFNRVTVFSNYSPYNAPAGHWSLMCEICFSDEMPLAGIDVVRETIEGLRRTGLLTSTSEVASTWRQDIEYFYPVPTLERNDVLDEVQAVLLGRDIYSRGRFGAWLYEISNMDHCVMQGVEVADHLVIGTPELTWINAAKIP